MQSLKFLAMAGAISLLWACGDASSADICGTPTPAQPLSANATARAQQLRKDLNGKWQWVSMYQKYTATGKEATHKPDGDKRFLCFAQNGGLKFFWKNEEKCPFLYNLVDTTTGVLIRFKLSQPNEWCGYQVHDGLLEVRKDSIIITNEEPLQIRKTVYRRVDENGMFK